MQPCVNSEVEQREARVSTSTNLIEGKYFLSLVKFYLFIFNVFEALEVGPKKTRLQISPSFFFYFFGSVEIMDYSYLSGFSEPNQFIECYKREKDKLFYDFWAALEIRTNLRMKACREHIFLFRILSSCTESCLYIHHFTALTSQPNGLN